MAIEKTSEAVDLATRRQKLVENMEPMQKALHLLQMEMDCIDRQILDIALEQSAGKIYRVNAKNFIHYTLPFSAGIHVWAMKIYFDKKETGQFRVEGDIQFSGLPFPRSESEEVDRVTLLRDLGRYCPFLLTLLGPERNAVAGPLKEIIADLTELSTHLSNEENAILTLNIKRAKLALYLALSLEGTK